MMQDISKGMLYLHTASPPIIHRDMKSLNLLLDSPITSENDNNVCVKIADFGLSRTGDTEMMTGVLGTF